MLVPDIWAGRCTGRCSGRCARRPRYLLPLSRGLLPLLAVSGLLGACSPVGTVVGGVASGAAAAVEGAASIGAAAVRGAGRIGGSAVDAVTGSDDDDDADG